jgi:ribA/ribD-fused uncharacterized protein
METNLEKPMPRPSRTNFRELPASIQIPSDGRILFFLRDREMYFFLSHFHAAEIVVEGEVWPTVEHYFQSRKSLDPAYRDAIRACVHPGIAKRLGAAPDRSRRYSAQSWFRAHRQKHREDWPAIHLDLMRQADYAKFSQHPPLRDLLIATGTAEIVEDTTVDDFWGIGPDGKGENWAGRILMEVRTALASSHPRI